MTKSINYGTQTIEYSIIRKPRLKHTYIQVDSKGVIVKANSRVGESEIEALVLKKSAWILKHLQSFKNRAKESKIETGSRIYYLGKSYYTKVIKEESREDIEVKFSYAKFVIKSPKEISDDMLYQAIDRFYKEKAVEKIMPLVDKWSSRMDLIPGRVTFRKARKRWGSCSYKNSISLNYHLMKLPTPCIEYVIIHELAHIRHKNHSAEFWALVAKYMPRYKEVEKQIKEYEKLF